MLTTATCVLAASMLVGQADEPSAYEHMKDLDFLIGRNVAEFEMPAGREEFAPKGTKIVRSVSARWGLNKSIIIFNITHSEDGGPPVPSLEIAYWDPKAKRIAHSILVQGGSSSDGVWSKDGDDLILKWSITNSEGNEYAGTGRMRATGRNGYTWGITDMTKNGEKIPDIPLVQFKKQSGKKKRPAK